MIESGISKDQLTKWLISMNVETLLANAWNLRSIWVANFCESHSVSNGPYFCKVEMTVWMRGLELFHLVDGDPVDDYPEPALARESRVHQEGLHLGITNWWHILLSLSFFGQDKMSNHNHLGKSLIWKTCRKRLWTILSICAFTFTSSLVFSTCDAA